MTDLSDHLEEEKRIHLHLEETTQKLYSLRCFETLTHPSGTPLAMRVPGGWIFYMAGGGGQMRLLVGDDDDESIIAGEINRVAMPVFVPYTDEFSLGCDPNGASMVS